MFRISSKEIINACIVTIIVTLIIAISVTFKNRYFTPELSLHYSILDVRGPSTDKDETQSDSQVLRIFIRNNSNNVFGPSEINIGGVEKFYGLNKLIAGDGKMTNTPDVSHSLNESIGYIVLNNIPLIESGSELGIYVWGKFYSTTYVEATSREETIRAREAVLVTGVEKFFATYWEAILIIFITVIIFLYYYFGTRMNRDI